MNVPILATILAQTEIVNIPRSEWEGYLFGLAIVGCGLVYAFVYTWINNRRRDSDRRHEQEKIDGKLKAQNEEFEQKLSQKTVEADTNLRNDILKTLQPIIASDLQEYRQLIKDELLEQKSKNKTLNERVTELETKLQQTMKTLDETLKALEETKRENTKVKDLQDQLTKLQEHVQKLQGEVEKLMSDNVEKNKIIEENQQKIQELETQIEDANGEVIRLTQLIEEELEKEEEDGRPTLAMGSGITNNT